MKFTIILIIAGLVGYNSGLIMDVAANGDDSKLQTFAKTGQIDSKWIPFSLDKKIIETHSFTQTFPFGGGGPILLFRNCISFGGK